jgi:ribonucleoside-diphosphate reductase alpha chain
VSDQGPKKFAPAIRPPANIAISENGRQVLQKRYLRKGPDGKPIEDIEGMFRRVAHAVAAPDAAYGYDVATTEDAFYSLLTSLRFFPNSPTFTGAGTPLGQLAACFVMPISDDLGKNPDGIFQTLRDAALIQQTGGGNGFSFSRLRPKGDSVATSAGVASGPVGFLRVYDTAFGEVAQGGTRRGANMAVLRVDHPDIEQFITCKAREGQISNFNISVGITDKFMQAVADDADFDLVNPRDGKVWQTMRARDLFDKMVTFAHHNGEPGALFLDAANRSNPVPHLYELEATNPCVTADTWVHTAEGPRQVSALVGQSFVAVVNGQPYPSDARGFWSTGIKDIYELRTTDGLRLRLTGNHPILRVDELERQAETTHWVEAAQLQPGDRVKLHDHRSFDCWPGPGSYADGWLLGLLTGDGTFSVGHGVLSFWGEGAEQMSARALSIIKANYKTRADLSVQRIPSRDEYRVRCVALNALAQAYGIGPGHKTITDAVEVASSDFCRGFLQGLFDTDGSLQDAGDKGLSVRLAQSDRELLERAQRMLLRLGIHSVIYANRRGARETSLPDGHGGRRSYNTQPQHELAISKDNLAVFARGVGFTHPQKAASLSAALAERTVRGPYRERFVAEIECVIPAGQAEVFDCAIAEVHAFDAQGFVAHNCGEQWLGPNENCCLGSINLAQHVTSDGKVDWDKLCESSVIATRFLDDVVDANKYVPAVPQLSEAAHRARRIGLGIMGLGDLMYAVGVRYGSAEAQELAGQVMEFVRFHSMRTSIELATERGPFPAITGSIYDPDNLRWQPPTPLVPFTHDSGRPSIDWSEIVNGILQHGIRNAAQTTVAPTGTIGTVAGCEGYGCEPVFALAYTRTVKDGDRDLKLTYTSPLFTAAMAAAGLDAAARERISEEVSLTGSCQNVPGVPQAIRHTFVVSSDITAEEHVRMQAAIQAFVDNSISKTCNFPPSATIDDVKKAYQLAWQLGCKGLTVYVTGSRQEVVLETKATAEQKNKPDAAAAAFPAAAPTAALTVSAPAPAAPNTPSLLPVAHPAPTVHVPTGAKRPRPSALAGLTYRKETPLGTAFVTVNVNGDEQPFEVFLNVGKAGSDVAAVSEALGRLISLILRLPSPLATVDRLREVIDQLAGIGGGRTLGFGAKRVRSLPDAVAQVLREHVASYDEPADEADEDDGEAASHPVAEQLALPISDRPIGDLCPDCGQATFIPTEGCRKCYVCGYSEC